MDKRRKKKFRPVFCSGAGILFCIFLAGCAGSSLQNTPEPDRTPQQARRVVFIGLDGWGAAYLPRADMPVVKRMIREGASSVKVLNVLPTNSGPNWSSLFRGAPPEHNGAENFPSIFSLLQEQGRGKKAAFFYEWSGLEHICGEDMADKRGNIETDMKTAREIGAYIIKNKPDLTVIVFNEPDSTGHSERWGSKAYYAKLAELDALIAVIEQAVRDAGIYHNTVFVLSADHGGILWGHGFNSPRQREIPLIIYGDGIKRDYAIPSPLSICDIAPTMALVLGLRPSPQWTGRPLGEIFE
ncbi:MAG: alkaline phosphatase [Spirochaetaceae bacterium]|jgi:predicted AlkP superfamily pyrophosphatase or phosphodiesterase|nr:alkaline phosphatase [Spirochaetaceae bacterium]